MHLSLNNLVVLTFQIIGSDFCGKFINAAEKLRQNGCLAYHMSQCTDGPSGPKYPKLNADGDIIDMFEARVPCDFDSTKVDFKQVCIFLLGLCIDMNKT